MAARITAVIACDIDVPMAHGFVPRYEQLISSLRRHGEVEVIGLATRAEALLPFVGTAVVSPDAFDEPGSSPAARLGRAARLLAGRLLDAPFERALDGAIASTRPDVVVGLTYRQLELTRIMARSAPVLLFAEERSGRSWRRPRLLQIPPPVPMALVVAAERRAARRADRVAVIGPAELAWATEVLDRPTFVVPLTFDIDWWARAAAADPDSGPLDVSVVGNLREERNAAGLAAVLDALDEQGWGEGLRLRLVSATGYHPSLEGRDPGRVRLEGAVEDPRPIMAGSAAVLAPAERAFGIKTGILQGWAAGRPVVATAAAAATVGGVDGADLLVGSDAAAVARVLNGLGRAGGLDRLTAAGRDHLNAAFSTSAQDAGLDAALLPMLEAALSRRRPSGPRHR